MGSARTGVGLIDGRAWTYARAMSSVNNVERTRYVKFGPETDVNRGAIEFYRRTFLFKCEGLSDEQLRRRPIASSTMSL